jgi:hypothetical protein
VGEGEGEIEEVVGTGVGVVFMNLVLVYVDVDVDVDVENSSSVEAVIVRLTSMVKLGSVSVDTVREIVRVAVLSAASPWVKSDRISGFRRAMERRLAGVGVTGMISTAVEDGCEGSAGSGVSNGRVWVCEGGETG